VKVSIDRGGQLLNAIAGGDIARTMILLIFMILLIYLFLLVIMISLILSFPVGHYDSPGFIFLGWSFLSGCGKFPESRLASSKKVIKSGES
jgi:hypothetical protein